MTWQWQWISPSLQSGKTPFVLWNSVCTFTAQIASLLSLPLAASHALAMSQLHYVNVWSLQSMTPHQPYHLSMLWWWYPPQCQSHQRWRKCTCYVQRVYSVLSWFSDTLLNKIVYMFSLLMLGCLGHRLHDQLLLLSPSMHTTSCSAWGWLCDEVQSWLCDEAPISLFLHLCLHCPLHSCVLLILSLKICFLLSLCMSHCCFSPMLWGPLSFHVLHC